MNMKCVSIAFDLNCVLLYTDDMGSVERECMNPLPLQVQLSGFVGAFWTLMCLKLGAMKGTDEQT